MHYRYIKFNLSHVVIKTFYMMINSDIPVNLFLKTDQYYWWEMNEEML